MERVREREKTDEKLRDKKVKGREEEARSGGREMDGERE